MSKILDLNGELVQAMLVKLTELNKKHLKDMQNPEYDIKSFDVIRNGIKSIEITISSLDYDNNNLFDKEISILENMFKKEKDPIKRKEIIIEMTYIESTRTFIRKKSIYNDK